jgi:hypothetical protein
MIYEIETTQIEDAALADYLANNASGATALDFITSIVTAQLDLFVAQMKGPERAALIAKFEAADKATQDSIQATLEKVQI